MSCSGVTFSPTCSRRVRRTMYESRLPARACATSVRLRGGGAAARGAGSLSALFLVMGAGGGVGGAGDGGAISFLPALLVGTASGEDGGGALAWVSEERPLGKGGNGTRGISPLASCSFGL